jgi:acetyltransferase-like isoleucine patch superfamily enzyme
LFSRLAAIGIAPYHSRVFLSRLSIDGFVDPDAALTHPDIKLGNHIYLGKEVIAYSDSSGGRVSFGDHTQIYGQCLLRTGQGAGISFGRGTHVQMGCTFVACLSSIDIGDQVEIASGCSFYSFNHGVAPGKLIMEQELESKGPIKIGDGAWLGHGVTVLEGTRIGSGAVVGAGSVVTKDVPDNAIAVGAPAKVIRMR